jgi:fructan beta-fructosidase
VSYQEEYRPQYHFTPHHNWTNDPNGLVFYDGEYHLFYQYNPYANRWGHMSWGHAVSPDLLHWTHLPVAIEEYADRATGDSTMIFSGSAVIDTGNTSGLFENGKGGLVAVYTSHVHKAGEQLIQHQSIASSNDKGRTFNVYAQNPVLDIQRKDFRDPKVFWYEPKKYWVMAAVIPDEHKVHFYLSPDLKTWTFLSAFGPMGDTAKIWECPDLVQVPYLDDKSRSKWILIVSNSHPQGPDFVGMQYFVGDFDGNLFTADEPSRYPRYVDYGKDFYAAITYHNAPGKRVILLGWANNWAYAGDIPTTPWKGMMAIPRELYLADVVGDGTSLIQQPVSELANLRGAEVTDINQSKSKSVEILFKASFGNTQPKGRTGIKVLKGNNEETLIYYDAEAQHVYIDRTRSGRVDFHPLFPGIDGAPAMLQDMGITLHVFIDQSIIEVFINDGRGVITSQVFPTSGAAIETFADDPAADLSLQVWNLKSVWK